MSETAMSTCVNRRATLNLLDYWQVFGCLSFGCSVLFILRGCLKSAAVCADAKVGKSEAVGQSAIMGVPKSCLLPGFYE